MPRCDTAAPECALVHLHVCRGTEQRWHTNNLTKNELLNMESLRTHQPCGPTTATGARRTPLLSYDNEGLNREDTNSIASAFKEAFSHLFAENILPSGLQKFRREDAPLYVNRRELSSKPDGFPTSDLQQFCVEAELHQIFWDPEHHNLVFIEGAVGCGKSTLIDYYLRCYCPDDPERRKDFDRKLIISIDLRSVRTTTQFEERFYPKIREAIRAFYHQRGEGQDLDSEDSYVLWDPIFAWDSNIHKMAIGSKDMLQYRAELVALRQAQLPLRERDKEWVNLALKRISEKLAKNAFVPFSFLVLCMDNLDQSPFEIQEQAIATVRDWIKQGIRLWQVYVPLWPQSLVHMLRNVSPLPRYHRVPVGCLASEEVMERRSESALTRIVSSGKSLRLERKAEMGGPVEFTNAELLAFVRDSLRLGRDRFTPFLNDLAGESTRRSLMCWEIILSSNTLQNHFESGLRLVRLGQQKDVFRSTGVYALIDALLTGKHKAHHGMENPIANLFHVVPNPESERDILLGCHMLILMRRGIDSRTHMEEYLSALGYSPDKIRLALLTFHRKYFFEWASEHSHDLFVLHARVVRAHLSLICDPFLSPAYADNMALVTPVERGVLELMKETNSYDPQMFIDRVKTTLSFLGQLLDDEIRFCQRPHLLEEVDPRAFPEKLSQLQLPWISGLLAHGVKVRLEELCDKGYLRNYVTPGNWKNLLQDPVLLRVLAQEGALRPMESALDRAD